MIKQFVKKIDSYKIAVMLSTLSMGFGLLREFIIVGILGFSTHNDSLQLYLSIFYTIGLTIDAMRLSCLNLYSVLSLRRIIFSASVISLPFTLIIGLAMSYATDSLDPNLLLITLMGSYLNLIAALLITYKQRNDHFLAAQIINVFPNFILIPGILICYWWSKANLIFTIICLTSFIPVAQCTALLLLRNKDRALETQNAISFPASIRTFMRHFSAMISEQFYQVLLRSAFFNFGTGYLSLFAIAVRIYSAARFILIDSFIGSKLANWKLNLATDIDHVGKVINLTLLSLCICIFALSISVQSSVSFHETTMQLSILLILGFYFSTLVRITYFKINRQKNNPGLVMRFALSEFVCLLLAFWLTKQANYPILTLIWLGYIAKPFAQLLLLRKHYHGLNLEYGTTS